MDYFASTRAHNTIQFGQHDQMPKVGRFLYSHWLRTSIPPSINASGNKQVVQLEYKGRYGEVHIRKVELSGGSLVVKDTLKNVTRYATARWRLGDGNYVLQDNTILGNGVMVEIESSCRNMNVGLTEGLESKFYNQKVPVMVVEIMVDSDCEIRSKFRWCGLS